MNGKSTVKTVLVMVILVLVGVLGVLGINTVRTYMSGAAVGYEPKGVAAKANPDGKSAVVTWTTEKPVMAIVEYGAGPASLLLRAVETSQETNHSVTISSLKPNVNYYYRIRVREKDDEDTIYDNNGIPYNFTTKVDESAAAAGDGAKNEVVPTKATVPTSAAQTSTCDRTKDYNLDGAVNSRDMMECMKKSGSSTSVPSTATATPTKTATAVPTSASGCNRTTDYDKNGTINNADWFKCLQDNPR